MVRRWKVVAALGGAVAIAAVAIGAGTASAKPQAHAKARYTNATNVKKDCPVHWNYPKAGLPDLTYPAGPSTPSKVVGVRYTAGGYALILDYARSGNGGPFPHWGWIDKGCLVDPVARKFPSGTPGSKDNHDAPDDNNFAPALPERHAVGGNNEPKVVDITPGHHGEPKTTLHMGSNGTLRNGPKQFATGNLHDGWEFKITREHCRTEDGHPFKPDQWVFGYAPQAGRWGWVQARHLPACL